ncbi:MAG: zinc metalloprotease HtpX [Thermococcus sp.]|uniref:zinc metalloprotease HtpX n=1 Tax=Thermococcus sp. TaxID=35749 RepID=UPI001D3718DB|nr:zinc metalloprotease HtpX [Thermococcus sp.]MBO8174564.1 zinc metalloprotease HtpX [Thermococcus sp.]
MGLGLWFRTGLLMAFLTGLLMALGYVLGNGSMAGVAFAFMFAMVLNFFSYWYSDKIVLTWYKARIVDEMEAPELYRIVEGLAREAGIPTPKIAIVPTDVPNAFATGRDPKHAVVAVTQGLLRILDRDELEGVLAHEISHIKNRDILIQTLAAVLAGAVIMIARWASWMLWLGGFGGRDRDRDAGSVLGAVLLIILAPIAAMMIQMAISRAREYLADESGAKISGKPWALARALEKIEYYVSRRPLKEGNPATAHMFIVNPFRGISFAELFSTHPPTQKRIERLRKIAMEMGMYF